MIVVCSGLIGVGKTTLCENLCEQLNAIPFFEPVDSNPFLDLYYKNPMKYSFPMQVNLLSERFTSYQEAQWRSLRNELCICDRSLYEDYAFALVQSREGYMEDLLFEAYNKMHTLYTSFLNFPDIILYIKTDVKTALERIARRSRTCESGIPESYMEKLLDAYSELMPILSKKCPVVEIDGRKTASEVLIDSMEAVSKRRADTIERRPVYHGGF